MKDTYNPDGFVCPEWARGHWSSSSATIEKCAGKEYAVVCHDTQVTVYVGTKEDCRKFLRSKGQTLDKPVHFLYHNTMTNKKFLTDCKTFLKTLPACTGDMARLAHRLSEAVARLEAVVDQANAQFGAGDRHATFNKQFVERLGQ